MIPMSRHFGEIHGVDVSDEMVALARQRLREIPNAQVHATAGDGLGLFPNVHFDFIYSYIVFQHIPDRKIVLNYLREAQRVLKPGGVLCCQLRGTAPLASEMSRESETWTGCHFNAGEMAQFAREQAFPLVEISGLDTQYMWTTFRAHHRGGEVAVPGGASPVESAVTAASGPEPCVPALARMPQSACGSRACPKAPASRTGAVWSGDREQLGCYLSPVAGSGGCQLNARLPGGLLPGVNTRCDYGSVRRTDGDCIQRHRNWRLRPGNPGCSRLRTAST